MDLKSFVPHLEELRTRFLRAVVVFVLSFLVCYIFSDLLFYFMALPMVKVWKAHHRFIYTGVTEAFMTHIRLAAFGGFFISIPYTMGQVWGFIAPGLYIHEKKLFKTFLVLTPVLFVLGACFAYLWVMPTAYQFFLSFEMPNAPVPIQAELRLEEYLSFVTHLILAFGFCFQIPVLMMVLSASGFLSAQTIKEKWRTAFLIISVLCALITPADLLSMIFLLLPLFALYGLSFAGISLMERTRKKETTGVGHPPDSNKP